MPGRIVVTGELAKRLGAKSNANKSKKAGSGKSELEEEFAALWSRLGNGSVPQRQFRFHPVRKWLFDFAWPEQMLAVEIHGGTFSRSRSGHTTGAGHHRDIEKANSAVLLGWRVLSFTVKHVRGDQAKMIDQVLAALRGDSA